MSSDKRPISPHLSIYKPQISTVLSITHRMSGVALYAGTAMIVWWLWVLAYNPSGYAQMLICMQSAPGQVVLLGWTAAFYFHLGNGIRHLFWDVGMGFSLPQMHRSGWLVVIFTVAMTALTWNFILPMR